LRDGAEVAAPQRSGPSGGGSGARSSGGAQRMAAQPAAGVAPEPALRSFDDVVALIDRRRDIALRLDVEKYLRLISFRTGAIAFEPAPGAPNNLAQRLSARLKEWTGQAWLVAAETGGGAQTLAELKARESETARAEALADPFVRQVMNVFPGAELTEIRQIAPETAPTQADDEDEES